MHKSALLALIVFARLLQIGTDRPEDAHALCLYLWRNCTLLAVDCCAVNTLLLTDGGGESLAFTHHVTTASSPQQAAFWKRRRGHASLESRVRKGNVTLLSFSFLARVERLHRRITRYGFLKP